MKLRVARHTSKLTKITHFYSKVLGLDVTGSFEEHDGYNGVFLSTENANWELEFTSSTDVPNHTFDEDDALVFYPNSETEFNAIRSRCIGNNLTFLTPKNPYWQIHGFIIQDPDGGFVIVSNRVRE